MRLAALVSDEKRIRGVRRRTQRCAIQIDNLYLYFLWPLPMLSVPTQTRTLNHSQFTAKLWQVETVVNRCEESASSNPMSRMPGKQRRVMACN